MKSGEQFLNYVFKPDTHQKQAGHTPKAGIAKTPEKSEYTSIKSRLEALDKNLETAPCLYPFIGAPSNKMLDGIPFKLIDYIELVDWTVREFRDGKASMNHSLPPIRERLNFNQQNWLKACTILCFFPVWCVSAYFFEHLKGTD